jgi:cyclopropane fatty-acyl-phospholipid synthase-like methyltransferase
MSMNQRPYAASCEQNREPIAEVLERHAEGRRTVLEIGSGTGQHAVYFAQRFDWLDWQPSDLEENHEAINAWRQHSACENVREPLPLDVSGDWPQRSYDLVFTANTLHIMARDEVEDLFARVPRVLHRNSRLLIYGPFNYEGRYSSMSNARFDQWLRQQDPLSGIKDFEWLQDLAVRAGLECIEDVAMPANNRLLVWQRFGAE